MGKTIKYYSFIDLVTNSLTKNVGWEEVKEGKHILIREVEGELKVLKDETKEITSKNIPRGLNVKEVSKEEYDKLDVSGEHPYLTEKRAQAEAALIAKKSAKQDYNDLARGELKLDAQAILASLQKSK